MSGVTGATTHGPMTVFNLTLPELLLLREHLPGLVLPAFVPATRMGDSVNDGASPADLLARLQSRQLVDGEADLTEADWSQRLPSVLLLGLSLQMTGQLVFQVQAWSGGASGGLATTAHSTTVTETVCAGLTLRSPAGAEAPTVAVTVAPLSGLYPSLAELIPADPAADTRPGIAISAGAVSLGLVESRALIDAIRAGDERVVASLTTEFHTEGARDVLQDLSGAMGTGYRIKAFGTADTAADRVLFSRDWYRSPRGWLKMSVTLPRPEGDSPPVSTAQALTDTGRVTIRRTSAAGIRQDLLGLIAEILARPGAEWNGAQNAR